MWRVIFPEETHSQTLRIWRRLDCQFVCDSSVLSVHQVSLSLGWVGPWGPACHHSRPLWAPVLARLGWVRLWTPRRAQACLVWRTKPAVTSVGAVLLTPPIRFQPVAQESTPWITLQVLKWLGLMSHLMVGKHADSFKLNMSSYLWEAKTLDVGQSCCSRWMDDQTGQVFSSRGQPFLTVCTSARDTSALLLSPLVTLWFHSPCTSLFSLYTDNKHLQFGCTPHYLLQSGEKTAPCRKVTAHRDAVGAF